ARSSAAAASSTTSAAVASAGNSPATLSARPDITRAPEAAAQMAARCDLPEPSGPTSATALLGQSGQLSISLSAAWLPGPGKKSSRAKLSAWGSASASCRGREDMSIQLGIHAANEAAGRYISATLWPYTGSMGGSERVHVPQPFGQINRD